MLDWDWIVEAQQFRKTSERAFTEYILQLEMHTKYHSEPKLIISIENWWKKSRFVKVEKILKGSLDSNPSPSQLVKIQSMGGKVCLSYRGKTLLGVVNKLENEKKVCWQCWAMFCIYTSSKLSCPLFEFSLKVKVMGSNPGYFLKSLLLCFCQ